VGRGVLLDYALWASKNSISLDVFTRTCIPISHLKRLIEEQQIIFSPGDILFLRTGFTSSFNNLDEAQQEAISLRPTADFAGIEASEDTLKFLWNNQFAAVASDCPSFEASPVHGPGIDDTWSLHEWLLGGWGMPIGEMFDLEALSEKCHRTGRWSFFLCSVPLKVPGGVASPPNAVAIF
jgi:kynurenine formamidase